MSLPGHLNVLYSHFWVLFASCLFAWFSGRVMCIASFCSFKGVSSSMHSQKVSNVFEAILKYGHDEDFVPVVGDDFAPTNAPAGSDEKIAILRQRVELGLPLWHGEDRRDYSGLTGAVRPRE
jgi:hypothetical protein